MQFLRFSLVGVMNTLIDIVAFNLFVLGFPTKNVVLLLVYNSLAYALGAFNSYLLNKYWTFQQRQNATGSEIMRFIVVSVCSIMFNNLILWLIAGIAHPFISNIVLWANIAKVIAISGTFSLSFLGMRLWVFAGATRRMFLYYNSVALKQQRVMTDNKGVLHQTTTYACAVQEESKLQNGTTGNSRKRDAPLRSTVSCNTPEEG